MGLTFANYVIKPYFPNCLCPDLAVRLLAGAAICESYFELNFEENQTKFPSRFLNVHQLLQRTLHNQAAGWLHVCKNCSAGNYHHCWHQLLAVGQLRKLCQPMGKLINQCSSSCHIFLLWHFFLRWLVLILTYFDRVAY